MITNIRKYLRKIQIPTKKLINYSRNSLQYIKYVYQYYQRKTSTLLYKCIYEDEYLEKRLLCWRNKLDGQIKLIKKQILDKFSTMVLLILLGY